MIKKVLLLLVIGLFFAVNTSPVWADLGAGELCGPSNPDHSAPCIKTYDCLPSQSDPSTYLCQSSLVGTTFGKIQAPAPLAGFLSKDPSGAGAISDFVSRLIILFFSIAGIVLIFMLLWGAFGWLTSGGEKEKLSAAQQRIINALIGILLFSVAFAIIQILGSFTGFTFFAGQHI